MLHLNNSEYEIDNVIVKDKVVVMTTTINEVKVLIELFQHPNRIYRRDGQVNNLGININGLGKFVKNMYIVEDEHSKEFKLTFV